MCVHCCFVCHPMSNAVEEICDGLTKEIIKNGDGATFPTVGQSLMAHYTGTLPATGVVFDSSRGEYADTRDGITVMKKKKPLTFVLGNGSVIKGWEKGIATMSLGEQATLSIRSDLAYGDKEVSCGENTIVPHSDLVFEITLLAIDKQYAHRSLW